MVIAKAKPLFISDFDGAVTKRETNDVLLRIADPKVSLLRKALLEERRENIEFLRPSGLLKLAPQAGFHVVRKGASHFVKRISGQQEYANRKKLPPAAMPELLAARMERYYGHKGPTISEFFSCLLRTDNEIDEAFAGAPDVMMVHDRQLSRMLEKETSQVQFHSFLDTIYKSFLTRSQVEAASRFIADGLVRPGMANAISGVKKEGGHIVFCSYSYLQIMNGVLQDMMRRVGKEYRDKMHCVANNIRFGEGNARDRIVGIDRIGDKWAALDAHLSMQNFPKQGGKYLCSVVYDDSEYNLPDMAKNFSSAVLLVPNGNSKKPGAMEKYAAYAQKYPNLRICTETDISGVGSLRAIMAEEFENFRRAP